MGNLLASDNTLKYRRVSADSIGSRRAAELVAVHRHSGFDHHRGGGPRRQQGKVRRQRYGVVSSKLWFGTVVLNPF